MTCSMPVYFVRAGNDGPVKIGWSTSISSRIRALQTAHYLEIIPLREIDCDIRGERIFHNYFYNKRIRGEWFEYDEIMLTITLEEAEKHAGTPALRILNSLKDRLKLSHSNNGMETDKKSGVVTISEDELLSECEAISELSSQEELETIINRIASFATIPIVEIRALRVLSRKAGIPIDRLRDSVREMRLSIPKPSSSRVRQVT